VRVLLVDDNDAMLARAQAMLSSCCDIVGAVKDGLSALESVAALHPDVVVLDIPMPGLSGLDVALNLRTAGSTVAVVFLTVHDEEDFVVAARNAGGLGYVVKSRLAADLIQAVREASAGRPFVSPTLSH
jgi:DNA-binding NarL/FixJ family response regulator